ncbi:MAG: purine-nucleoside phosphorylase [Nitratiruptor sp.]|nr:purine-nucleoside phosphorylase [Nitratiruptor sp.]NPA82953.1 5'-methylthioadenosine/S-adenosylhomocysteine nucleosidase [Campylobacterota bacterium]
MILCAGAKEHFPFALPIGVGLVEAAMNVTRLLLLDRPDFLLFVGSAGSYGQFDLFEIVSSRGASQIEGSFWDRCAYTPLDNAIISEGLDIEHKTIVNSSNYITTCKGYWERFNRAGIGLENMEFFAILRVAQAFQVPAGGIFVVTNFCDATAHESYEANLPEAMKRLEAYVRRHILKGGS